MKLILASASPRRQQLLRDAGYAFTILPADVDEDPHMDRFPPAELVRFLSTAKAEAVSRHFPDAVTLAADTVVAIDGRSLSKPENESAARAMIQLLTGRAHQVLTGLCVRCPSRDIDLQQTALSTVTMAPLTEHDLNAYLATGHWNGKAGAYGIQDPNPIVMLLTGSLTNVIGLPMDVAAALLAKAGIAPIPKTEE